MKHVIIFVLVITLILILINYYAIALQLHKKIVSNYLLK